LTALEYAVPFEKRIEVLGFYLPHDAVEVVRQPIAILIEQVGRSIGRLFDQLQVPSEIEFSFEG